MGKILKLFFLLFVGVSLSFAQGVRKDDVANSNVGGYVVVSPFASIRVCQNGAIGLPCTPLAQIYSNSALTNALPNPFTADANGNYFFYAFPGTYVIQSTNTTGTFSQPDQTLPNLPSVVTTTFNYISVPFSSTPVFSFSPNTMFKMVLTGNVTSSTLTGGPVPGATAMFSVCEDSFGGHSFSFPSNFVLPPGFTFSQNASVCNNLLFSYDGTNWQGVGGGGGGGGSMVYPSGTGIPQVLGGAAWSTTLGKQGTDGNVLTSGTVSGTSIPLCTDALGGATTSECPPLGGTPGTPIGSLQFDNSGVFGGSSLIYTPASSAACALNPTLAPCGDYVLPNSSDSCIGSDMAGDPTTSLFGNFMILCAGISSKGGTYVSVDSTTSNPFVSAVGLEGGASSIGVGGGVYAAGVSGDVTDDPSDTSSGQVYYALLGSISLTRASGNIATMEGLHIRTFNAQNGGPLGAETTQNFYGVHLPDMLNKGTTTAALQIDSQTPGGWAVKVDGGPSQFAGISLLPIVAPTGSSGRTWLYMDSTANWP